MDIVMSRQIHNDAQTLSLSANVLPIVEVIVQLT